MGKALLVMLYNFLSTPATGISQLTFTSQTLATRLLLVDKCFGFAIYSGYQFLFFLYYRFLLMDLVLKFSPLTNPHSLFYAI